MARPIPPLPPVITATLPLSSMSCPLIVENRHATPVREKEKHLIGDRVRIDLEQESGWAFLLTSTGP
jgi:hypothetical protein